jgi:cation diffusion facilitator CzcD-associated flavoprotein CzcO
MNTSYDVAIIGAGFAGLTAAIRLQQRGHTSFVVFERAARVGGTWRDNIYPGCAVDIPAPLYSMSFAPNPNWSRLYSGQPEILAYLQDTVRRFRLEQHIRLQTEIVRTEFRAEEGRWHLTDRAGNLTTARVVLLAIGPLNRPAVPKLQGLENFRGQTFHSSQWDTGYNLTGRRVAVVGTGASAIQFIPEIAPQVAQLYVFQRTAPWILPRLDRPFSAREQGWFRRLPLWQKLLRTFMYWRLELQGLMFLGNERLAKLATSVANHHRRKALKHNPELLAKATPNYQMGCKRVLLSNDYYPALARPNVELITEPIRELTAHGIVSADGREREIDALIFGTGFVASAILVDLHITGLGGRNLFQDWQAGAPEAYHGTAVSGFPNLLFIVGPNTGLAHNSLVHIMESQVNYVLDYLRLLDQAGPGAYLDVKPEAQRQYNEILQQKLGTTVWASGCQSWYLNAQGKNTTLLPALTATFRRATKRVKRQDFVLGKASQPAGAA